MLLCQHHGSLWGRSSEPLNTVMSSENTLIPFHSKTVDSSEDEEEIHPYLHRYHTHARGVWGYLHILPHQGMALGILATFPSVFFPSPGTLLSNAGGEFIGQPGAWVHCGWQADDALIGAKSVDIKWDSIAMPFWKVEGRGRILNFNASLEFVLVFFSNVISFPLSSSGTCYFPS